jgi:acetyl esterase/lipase
MIRTVALACFALMTASPAAENGRPDSRLALGRALLEFEARWAAAQPDDPTFRRVDAEFDRVSVAFFGGGMQSALESLEALTASLPESPARAWPDASIPADLDVVREALEVKLEHLLAKEQLPRMQSAIRLAMLRADKLREDSDGDTFRLVESLAAHRDAVAAEVAALANGRDPYRGRAGNHWRAFPRKNVNEVEGVRDRAFPYRLVVPKKLAADSPTPLVVAFHGAGGDENMFAFAYGNGRLAQLANERGFLLAMPRSYSFPRDEDLLEILLADVERDFEFDRQRVYVLGHSLGAGVASALSRQSKVPIAAAALFTGNLVFHRGTPPTVQFVALDDPIIPPRKPTFAAGADPELLTFRRIENRGHTLFVGEYLPEAIDFLLQHKSP